jgi:hypothetical protein
MKMFLLEAKPTPAEQETGTIAGLLSPSVIGLEDHRPITAIVLLAFLCDLLALRSVASEF